MHKVVGLVVPDVIIFDLAIPAEIFGRAVEQERYAFAVCTEHPGAVRSTSGFSLEIGSGLDAIEGADTVIVPGFFPRTDPSPVVLPPCGGPRREAREWRRCAWERLRSLPPVCSMVAARLRTGSSLMSSRFAFRRSG